MKRGEFIKRQENFVRMMGEDSIAIIANSSKKTRNRDVYFPFRSDSDFYYLTGFNEEDAIAVLAPGRQQGKYILFCQEKDPKKELWDGEMIGLEQAMNVYQADDAYPIEDIEEILPGLLENRHKLYYKMGSNQHLDQHLIDWIKLIKEKSRGEIHAPETIISTDGILHEMRLIKSASEIAKMRRAAKITANAHIRAMKACKPEMFEYELEAEILYEIKKSGAQAAAYSSIVAGGKNACVLHYVENSEKLLDGELILLDAGAEFDHYATDVTRTFPVNGKFTPEQKTLYQIVLKAQNAAIDKCQTGNYWNDPHDAAVQEISRGLLELGILKGKLEDIIENEDYRRFFMHRTGHWLGMDVHDVGEYKISDRWRLLESGMTLTIEPGIYIPCDDAKDVDKKWHGIGIRIEDDILITKSGHEVLTKGTPKTVDAIEELMAKS